jgi:hypothetical protein
MLEFYGVDPERREELVEFARSARRGWWEAYGDTLAVPLVGLEIAADRILAYEPMAVHGLLQIPGSARPLIHAVEPDLERATKDMYLETPEREACPCACFENRFSPQWAY